MLFGNRTGGTNIQIEIQKLDKLADLVFSNYTIKLVYREIKYPNLGRKKAVHLRRKLKENKTVELLILSGKESCETILAHSILQGIDANPYLNRITFFGTRETSPSELYKEAAKYRHFPKIESEIIKLSAGNKYYGTSEVIQ